MGIVASLATYVLAFVALSALAFARSYRDKACLSVAWLGAFGAVGLGVTLFEGARGASGAVALASAAVVVCAASDLSSGLIYNGVLAAAFAMMVAFCIATGQGSQMLGGAAMGLCIPLILHVGTHGRGLGLGDVKLFSLVGGAFGAYGALAVIGSAFIVGACHALVMLTMGRTRFGAAIPFGPFIALGTMAVACAGLGI